MLLKVTLAIKEAALNGRKSINIDLLPQLKAKRQRSHENFAQSIMHLKPFTSKYVAHGIKYEPITMQEHKKLMFNKNTLVAVLRSALVVAKGYPVLGATPDAKIVDLVVQCHLV